MNAEANGTIAGWRARVSQSSSHGAVLQSAEEEKGLPDWLAGCLVVGWLELVDWRDWRLCDGDLAAVNGADGDAQLYLKLGNGVAATTSRKWRRKAQRERERAKDPMLGNLLAALLYLSQLALSRPSRPRPASPLRLLRNNGAGK